MNNKIILVDCDGVLLDWEHSFKLWVKEKGYEIKNDSEYSMAKAFDMPKPEMKTLIRHFNESANMCCLPPLRDAVKYVRKIHEELGYVFHCITSMTLNQHANKLREENLSSLFGKTTFEKVHCLDTGADKDDALLPYLDSGCVWVEDKIKNAELGDRLGLSSVLMKHVHQGDYANDDIPAVQSWKEIYEMLS